MRFLECETRGIKVINGAFPPKGARPNPDRALHPTIWQFFDANGPLAAEERSNAVLL